MPDSSRADRLILRVIERDPHAEPIPWTEPATTTITRPVIIGLFEDGRPVEMLILRRNVLVGGTTGAGKSGVVNVILAALVACADCEVWGIDLKGGMELQPWAECLTRLATTPPEAAELLARAVGELDRRAAAMAMQGKRLWEPTADDPAIEIVIDEYAELPADALDHADSIARRGRAVAVSLIAATQRPTQDAMGGNAVRSQMDVRLCLRVRERRDVDLILGQGANAAGWHAHALSQPGTFLLSDPEHTAPERARAYLITDAQIAPHATRHATLRHPGAGVGSERAEPRLGDAVRTGMTYQPSGAAGTLWDALRHAGPDGAPIGDLMAVTGMTRPTLYRHLAAHAQAGRATQTARGRWCAIAAGGRPPGRLAPPRWPRPGGHQP